MMVKKAFETLKGYCNKHSSCEKCRFKNEDGSCELQNIPCDWEMPKKAGDQDA